MNFLGLSIPLDPKSLIAQSIGVAGMILVFFSFQQKTQKRILILQLCSSSLFAIHFYLLGAISGSILNAVAAVRALIYSRRNEKQWAASPFWIWFFILVSIGVYFLSLFVFLPEINWKVCLLELLPVIGMTATTLSFRMEKASDVRKFSIISSPVWLVYNFVNRSIAGVITESFALCSLIIGMIRLDRKKKSA